MNKLSKKQRRRAKKGGQIFKPRNLDVLAMHNRKKGEHTDKKKQQKREICRNKHKKYY